MKKLDHKIIFNSKLQVFEGDDAFLWYIVIVMAWQMCPTTSESQSLGAGQMALSMSLMLFACWRDLQVTVLCHRTALEKHCLQIFSHPFATNSTWHMFANFHIFMMPNYLRPGTSPSLQEKLCGPGWWGSHWAEASACSWSQEVTGLYWVGTNLASQVSQWVNSSFSQVLDWLVSKRCWSRRIMWFGVVARTTCPSSNWRWEPISSTKTSPSHDLQCTASSLKIVGVLMRFCVCMRCHAKTIWFFDSKTCQFLSTSNRHLYKQVIKLCPCHHPCWAASSCHCMMPTRSTAQRT